MEVNSRPASRLVAVRTGQLAGLGAAWLVLRAVQEPLYRYNWPPPDDPSFASCGQAGIITLPLYLFLLLGLTAIPVLAVALVVRWVRQRGGPS
jgi:hypothetical protein